MSKMEKCPGSGDTTQMLAWLPDDTGYAGAVVCAVCSYGVLIVKGSARKAVSMAGYEGMAGTVRVHYVSKDGQRCSYRKGGS